jgi:UPF0755 protein
MMSTLHTVGLARRFSMLLIGLALVMFAACSNGGERALSVYLTANQDQLARPAGADDQPVRFTVEPGSPARVIGQQLEDAGLIRDALLFEAYVRVNGLSNQLEAGDFILSPAMTLPEIADALQHAKAASISVTLPEGWRLEQSADYLTRAAVVTDDRYLTQGLSGDLTGLSAERYAFLNARPEGASLEGYLFPDTYELPAEGASGADVLARQLDAFENKVVPVYQEARAGGSIEFDLHTVLTLASIVEREAVVPEERAAIAGVYLNRLANGMKLEADPRSSTPWATNPRADSGGRRRFTWRNTARSTARTTPTSIRGCRRVPSPAPGWRAFAPCSSRNSTTISTSWLCRTRAARTFLPAPTKSTWKTCAATRMVRRRR